jgi:cytochrome b6-f complex iron-sulfur subunit
MEINEPNPTLKRGEFLRSLGLSTSALMAFYCMGTLTACSTGNEPGPGTSPGVSNAVPGGAAGLTGNTTGSKIDFTIDLTSSGYSGLKTEGKFTIVGDVLVALAAGGRYVALSKSCTHEGAPVVYRQAQNDVYCDRHGSVFNLDGTVKASPATTPLKVYGTQLAQNGNSLRVFE